MSEETKDLNSSEEVESQSSVGSSVRPDEAEIQPTVDAYNSSANDETLLAALGYVLFIIPLLAPPKSAFKVFHANQSLLLLIFFVGGQIVAYILMFVLIGFLLMPLVYLVSFIFFIFGVVNALNGKQKRLPIIGQWDLLK